MRRRTAIWALAVSLLLAVTALPVTARAAFPGANGKIIFANDLELEAYNADGTGRLDFGAGNAPTYSPDGSQIAFSRSGAIFVER